MEYGKLLHLTRKQLIDIIIRKDDVERRLRDEINDLKRQLADEKVMNKILNTMIDIADEQLGTQIRKKYNTQQSSNTKTTRLKARKKNTLTE